MRNFLILFLLNFYDFFHKKKILSFLKKKGFSNFKIFFDIGAHKGETINLFIKNFKIENIYSFEASPINFEDLKKIKTLLKKFINTSIILENYAVGENVKKIKIKHLVESSSSTLKELNTESKYYKKKFKFLNKKIKGEYHHNIEVNMITLKNYIEKKKIENIDLMKIDTEGYEFEVLLGLKEKLKNVKLILFEHHYDDMIKKNYNFGNLHNLLVLNNFSQIFKIKMPFRKSFEYIYKNNLIN